MISTKTAVGTWFLPNSHDFVGISLCNKIIYDGFQAWLNNLKEDKNIIL